MSPRLASAMIGMCLGTERSPSRRVCMPPAPIASKNARFGLYAQAISAVASTISCRNEGTCGCGIRAGSGSRPMQRKLLLTWTALRSFSVNNADLRDDTILGTTPTTLVGMIQGTRGEGKREPGHLKEEEAMRIDVALLPGQTVEREECVCVVVDVLRASSSVVTLLEAGAACVVAATGVEEARTLHGRLSDCLLRGEQG